MAVVDDVFLTFLELELLSVTGLQDWRKHQRAYILANDSTKAGNPHEPDAGDLVYEKTFAGEDSFADTLILILFDDTLGTRHKGVFANIPMSFASQAKSGYISESWWRKEKLPWAGVTGRRHFTAGNELLHGKFNVALQSYGW